MVKQLTSIRISKENYKQLQDLKFKHRLRGIDEVIEYLIKQLKGGINQTR